MNPTKIEWCDYTWNPVVGCAHGCSYCYARGINNRFKNRYPQSFAKDFSKPQFFPERLAGPSKVKSPKTVFVGSMSDPAFWKIEWWEKVRNVCNNNSQHTFMLLTKDAQKAYRNILESYVVPDNVMFGASIDCSRKNSGLFEGQYFSQEAINFHVMRKYSEEFVVRTFLSIEPLLGLIPEPAYYFDCHEKIIVGAMTGPGAVKPTQEMLDSISNIPKDKLFLKDSIKELMCG